MGDLQVYLNGEQIPISVKHLSSQLNNIIAPLIFPKGPDAIEMLRAKAPSTFWKQQVSKEIIRTFVFATSKAEALSVNGPMKPVQYLIQDAVDDNLEWRQDIPAAHSRRQRYAFGRAVCRACQKSC